MTPNSTRAGQTVRPQHRNMDRASDQRERQRNVPDHRSGDMAEELVLAHLRRVSAGSVEVIALGRTERSTEPIHPGGIKGEERPYAVEGSQEIAATQHTGR